MNWDCQSARTRFLDLLDDTMSDEAKGALCRHVDTCDTCAAELDALREGRARLVEPTPVCPRSTVRTQVLSYARNPQPGRAHRQGPEYSSRLVGAVALVAVVSAITIGVATSRRGADTDPFTGSGQFADHVWSLGEPAPEFAAMDVASGEVVSLADLQGQVVLLNIWATWCGPCEQEMPSLERLYRELGSEGLSIVAVSVDQESPNKVRRWVEAHGLTFNVLHDREGRFERAFPTVGVPESFVIDRQGRLVAREIGPRLWDSPDGGAVIRRLVENGGE